MTREIARLAASVCELEPRFAHHGGYLYLRDPQFVVRGYAADAPPGGCYVWKYMIPIFDWPSGFSLDFAFRVDNGYFSSRGKTDQEMAETFLSIISDDLAASDICELEDFGWFLEADQISASTRRRGRLLLDGFERGEQVRYRIAAADNFRRMVSASRDLDESASICQPDAKLRD